MKKMERCENLARRIFEAREAHGMMAKDVAKFIGVTVGTMSRFENGMSTPNAMQIKRLAEILPVNLNWLITGRGSRDLRASREDRAVPVYEGRRDYIQKGGEDPHIEIPGIEGATEAYQILDLSMSPRIMVNDYVLVDRNEPSVGDLVAFRNEYFDVKVGWLRAEGGDGERYYVPESPDYGRALASECSAIGRVICSVRVDMFR